VVSASRRVLASGGQTGLYVLFKTVCDTYDLLPAENYKLPPEAEGLEPIEEHRSPVPSIMKSTATAGKFIVCGGGLYQCGKDKYETPYSTIAFCWIGSHDSIEI